MKTKLGKRLIAPVCRLLIAVLCLGCCSFAAAEEEGKAARTIMLYDCGADLESSWGMATYNLYQILASEIPEGINVVVMTGGSAVWQTDGEYLKGAEDVCPDGRNRIWVCSGRNAADAVNGHGVMTPQTDMPEEIAFSFLSDPETLKTFIDYAAGKFPAEMYDLILWDHGGGPQYGFGIDENDPDENIMSVGALARALKESAVERFDIVDFDACLMSSVEIAAALSEYADYLVLSAETEPGYGQEYTTWLDALAADPGMNGFDLGKIIVDAFVAFYEDPDSDGYGQAGTLAVIDTKNFRERLMPRITQLVRVMDRELTCVGDVNLLLNFQDEYRSQSASYCYAYEELLDIGNFAEHLGICMSELSNEQSVRVDSLTNAYTVTAEAIKRILADTDGSGDDVIYARATENMTVPVYTRVAYVRNDEGDLERAEKMSPSGMSMFFAPASFASLQYMQAMDEMIETAESDDVREMLTAVETASLRSLMVTVSGVSVIRLIDEGTENVYYRTVRDRWKEPRQLSENEIEQYAMDKGLGSGVRIETMYASDWNAYVGRVIEWLDDNSNVDTETWLALLVAQQSSMAFDRDRVTGAAVDVNADGDMDVCRVTLPVPLSLVRDVSLSAEYTVDFFGEFDYPIGMVRGTPVTDRAMLDYIDSWYDMDYAVGNLYSAQTCAFDVPVAIDKWYELLDSEGIGHMIALMYVDNPKENELKIPVAIRYAEPDENGEAETDLGFLICRNGRIVGFVDQYTPGGPVISLNNKKFNRAVLYPSVAIPIFGDSCLFLETYDGEEGIALGTEQTEDRGMKIVMTGLDEIDALRENPLKVSVKMTDIYGCTHDITAAVRQAREAAGEGKMLGSIDRAVIKAGELTFNRRRQMPEFTVTVAGRELVPDVDYVMIGEEMFRAGTQTYTFVGIGDYVGVNEAVCVMAQAESSVDAAGEVLLSDAAGKTVLTVNTPAHPGNIAFDFTLTAENLRQYLEIGDDGRSVALREDAEAGDYVILVTVGGGAEDTYTGIDGESFTIAVKQ